MDWVEIIGYFGAALVVISFLVSPNVRVIRFINMLGALVFIIYGILLDMNIPIIFTNAFLICIQFYYLFIRKEKKTASE